MSLKTKALPGTGLVIDGEIIETPFTVVNYRIGGVSRFRARGEITEHKQVILHENAGSINITSLSTYLLSKGYGYHIIVDPLGNVSQHADLQSKLWHGGKGNKQGIGICFINPYYPKLVNTSNEKRLYKLIPASWWTHCSPKTDKRYAALTEAQLDKARVLLPFICSVLEIPYVFPTKALNATNRKLKGWLKPWIKLPEGIIAHRDYSRHSDGRYMLEHLLACRKQPCPTCGRNLWDV